MPDDDDDDDDDDDADDDDKLVLIVTVLFNVPFSDLSVRLFAAFFCTII